MWAIIEFFTQLWLEIATLIVATVIFLSLAKKNRSSPEEEVSVEPAAVQVTSDAPHSGHDTRRLQQAAFQALQEGDFGEVICALQRYVDTVGHIPKHFQFKLLATAASAMSLEDASAKLAPIARSLSADALEAAVLEAIRRGDMDVCHNLHTLAKGLNILLSPKTWRALVKANAKDIPALSALVAEAPAPLPRSFAEAVLDTCILRREEELAALVFDKVDPSDEASLRSHVETHLAKIDANKDIAAQANQLRVHARNGDLPAALGCFHKLRERRLLSTTLYNFMLDACVEARDLELALDLFQNARDEGLVDTVSFNIIMKGHLFRGNVGGAEGILRELKTSGLPVTAASYNALLCCKVQSGDSPGAWRIVDEMRKAKLPIGVVTGSILLRSPSINRSETAQIIDMINESNETTDEALLVAMVDACVRTGSMNLLTRKRAEDMMKARIVKLTSQTYGAMIKAYGQHGEIEEVWNLWNEMMAKGIEVTCVTFGCVIEALVVTGGWQEAWQLVNMTWADDSHQHLVTTVTYSILLKAVASSRLIAETMVLYEEMRARQLRPNSITYNTILNAFAQSGAMDRVPALLDDMRGTVPPVEPDLVTYSTLVKGYCASGDLDRGLKILSQMTRDTEHAPDEVMYNSLFDGCAKEQRLDDALRLLEDMKGRKIAPSNYTLTLLIKLMGRRKRLKQAFSLTESLSREYSIKLNLHVYTCLIQACFQNHQPSRALSVHDKILEEGLCPDEKLYTSLVRGCAQAGATEDAVRMVRFAYNLPDCGLLWARRGSPPGVDHRCLDGLIVRLSRDGTPQAEALLAEMQACRSQTRVPRRMSKAAWRQ